jgi:hypothetical protein
MKHRDERRTSEDTDGRTKDVKRQSSKKPRKLGTTRARTDEACGAQPLLATSWSSTKPARGGHPRDKATQRQSLTHELGQQGRAADKRGSSTDDTNECPAPASGRLRGCCFVFSVARACLGRGLLGSSGQPEHWHI